MRRNMSLNSIIGKIQLLSFWLLGGESQMLSRQLAGKFNADNFEFVLDNEHFDKKLSMEDSLLVTALSIAHSVAFSTAHNVPHLHPHHPPSEEDLDANHRLAKFAQFGSNNFISSPSPPPVALPSLRLINHAKILDSSSGGQLISTENKVDTLSAAEEKVSTQSVWEDKVDNEPKLNAKAPISDAEQPQSTVVTVPHHPPAMHSVSELNPTPLSSSSGTVPVAATGSAISFAANILVWLADSLSGMGYFSSVEKKGQHNSLRHFSN